LGNLYCNRGGGALDARQDFNIIGTAGATYSVPRQNASPANPTES